MEKDKLETLEKESQDKIDEAEKKEKEQVDGANKERDTAVNAADDKALAARKEVIHLQLRLETAQEQTKSHKKAIEKVKAEQEAYRAWADKNIFDLKDAVRLMEAASKRAVAGVEKQRVEMTKLAKETGLKIAEMPGGDANDANEAGKAEEKAAPESEGKAEEKKEEEKKEEEKKEEEKAEEENAEEEPQKSG